MNPNFHYSINDKKEKDHRYFDVSAKRKFYFEERSSFNGIIKHLNEAKFEKKKGSAGLFDQEDL